MFIADLAILYFLCFTVYFLFCLTKYCAIFKKKKKSIPSAIVIHVSFFIYLFTSFDSFLCYHIDFLFLLILWSLFSVHCSCILCVLGNGLLTQPSLVWHKATSLGHVYAYGLVTPWLFYISAWSVVLLSHIQLHFCFSFVPTPESSKTAKSLLFSLFRVGHVTTTLPPIIH